MDAGESGIALSGKLEERSGSVNVAGSTAPPPSTAWISPARRETADLRPEERRVRPNGLALSRSREVRGKRAQVPSPMAGACRWRSATAATVTGRQSAVEAIEVLRPPAGHHADTRKH